MKKRRCLASNGFKHLQKFSRSENLGAFSIAFEYPIRSSWFLLRKSAKGYAKVAPCERSEKGVWWAAADERAQNPVNRCRLGRQFWSFMFMCDGGGSIPLDG